MAGQDDSAAEVWARAVEHLADDAATSPQQLAFIRLARPMGLIDGARPISFTA